MSHNISHSSNDDLHPHDEVDDDQPHPPQHPPTMSVGKTLARLFSIPSNRRCAECRVTLVDSSQVFISYSPPPVQDKPYKSRYNQFLANHLHFAPPNIQKERQEQEVVVLENGSSQPQQQQQQSLSPADAPIDPCLLATARTGGHGVFVCAMCGAAHKLLGPSICSVHAIQDSHSWTAEIVQHVATAGGNQRAWKVYEAYVPHHWKVQLRLIPNPESSIADRLTFVRAKYQALAFLLPPASGPFAQRAWRRIIDLHPEWKGLWGAKNRHFSLADLELRDSQMSTLNQSFRNLIVDNRDSELPNRLVDYFCVVTASDYLDPSFQHHHKDFSRLESPDDVRLLTQVTDCFPDQNAHNDTEFPEHVGSFLFPDGCSPKSMASPPTFFTFVLTCADGSRLYGGVLRLYDKSSDVEGLRQVFENSGYKGKLPPWLSSSTSSPQTTSTSSLDSDLLYYPKCLVVLSHYPFFDLWRKFLLQIYRIALVEAPLPIERFIANFVAEVPLPPPGKIQVKFGFTANEIWNIRRPAHNQLPLFNCSYQPLFTVLSVPNVLVVMACLMQETRVALVSQHYALLGPVAEALVSVLFPFHWQGVYLPVMPYSMLEILDAPVPYLVGLHSRYLQQVPTHARPQGVVFVDLDRDVVHLGHDEENSRQPRGTPALPERPALKLKAKLDTYAALVYVAPNSGKVGTMTQGADERPVPFGQKCTYAQIAPAQLPSASSAIRRQDVLGQIDKAYRDSELLIPIQGFLSEHGQLYEKEALAAPLPAPLNSSIHSGSSTGNKYQPLRMLRLGGRNRRGSGGLSGESDIDDSSHITMNSTSLGSLLDLKDPPGFSATEIRGAFLRFFVSVLSNYGEYLSGDSFRATDFLASLNLAGPSLEFVRSMTKTQMFQRFLQERRDNPNDDEVLFFDQHINAKYNRSKKTALGRVRKETTFLDDTSRQFTDTYTPPPPSNWGLPDDGKAYHYGAFPELNPDLFGKIRHPREWPQDLRMKSIRSARRASIQAIGHERTCFNKAFNPVSMMSPVTIVAATKQGFKNLENALVSLSTPFSDKLRKKSVANDSNHSGGIPGLGLGSKSGSMRWGATNASPPSESTDPSEVTEIDPEAVTAAEEIVLNARRKTVILLGIFITLQVHCRAHVEMKKSRNLLANGAQVEATSIAGLHSIKRGGSVDKYYERATRIQSVVRRFLVRRLFLAKRRAVISIQARIRGRRIQFAYCLLHHAISKAQARCRSYLVRIRLEKFFEIRMRAYRNQIFKLWQRSYTPLSYRTKFWPFVEQSGFLRQGIAESELIRLWKELGIPVQDRGGGNPISFNIGNDKVVQQANVLGISNWVYSQCIMVNGMLAATTSKPSSVSKQRHSRVYSETGENVITGNNHSLLRLIAERKQVYERLSAIPNSGNEKLMTTLSLFDISPKIKKKKHALAEALWQSVDLADESRRVFMQLFPELKHSTDITFVEITKKGVGRRFRSSDSTTPEPLDSSLCADTLLQDRIRRHVASVASACMLKVPGLTLRLSSCRGATVGVIGSERQRRAAVGARAMFDWEECRLDMMKSLVSNNQHSTSRQVDRRRGSLQKALSSQSSSSLPMPAPHSPVVQASSSGGVRRNSTEPVVAFPDILQVVPARSVRSMSSASHALEEELSIVESLQRSFRSQEPIHFI